MKITLKRHYRLFSGLRNWMSSKIVASEFRLRNPFGIEKYILSPQGKHLIRNPAYVEPIKKKFQDFEYVSFDTFRKWMEKAGYLVNNRKPYLVRPRIGSVPSKNVSFST